jgi:outer membrane protein OmpA-like peptidoglycan-associated protein
MADRAGAVDRTGYDELTELIDSARVLEADVFAPKTWKKATEAYTKASEAIDLGKKQKSVNKYVDESREYAENAIKATEVSKLSLAEYLEPRDKAKTAKAATLVPKLYFKAEDRFKKATAKVESGDVKGALKEADKSSPLFDAAELEGVRADILGPADRLIEKAAADGAGKFALSTLDKARTARTKGNAIVTNNRYNRDEATVEAKRAEYEARHASNIALQVRSLNRNDQAWEKLMLLFEIQMNRVGETAQMEHLPFDDGPLAAADALISYIQDIQAKNESLTANMGDLSGYVTEQLQQMLTHFDQSTTDEDPLRLLGALDKQITDLMTDRDNLALQVETGQIELAGLIKKNEEITGELTARTEREEKFRTAKKTLNPSEGEVLFNSSNDIVLRLSGLSFDSGKDEIKDEHISLLEKVKTIIEMFPEAELVVEGHTDTQGEAAANVTLSEKRAFAVMQYMRQSLLIPADQIQSIGYGADRPIASNQTPDGRANNRRIDLIIMQ